MIVIVFSRSVDSIIWALLLMALIGHGILGGVIGAGGIGLQLNASINALQWSQVSVIFSMIIVLVIAAEWVSARVRGAMH
jgi:ABC-type phosphate/phosphonate transport system permease subunit